jgi:hypothetical protein
VWWNRWVVQAESGLALLVRAHLQAVPFLANAHLLGDSASGVVARNTILLTNPLEEAINNLKSDPLPLPVSLQLHDLLHSAMVCTLSLRKIVVVSLQNFNDLLSVGASLLFKLCLESIASG